MNYTILIILAVIGLWLVFIYNRLVVMKMRAKEATADIEVQLKRRFDLIPNLIETVKGYMTHEKEVLFKVTEARTKVAAAGENGKQKEAAENILTNTLKTLFAVAENYPDLKANVNFLELQRELSDTENKIQAARRFYNTTVMELNAKIEIFPNNLVAGMMGFKKMNFFEAEAGERENIKVSFKN